MITGRIIIALLNEEENMHQAEDGHRAEEHSLPIERVQIGARMEKRMVKVLKGLAEYLDLSLGDLLEGIVLHAFESKTPFDEDILRRIAQLKEVYGMDYGAGASHRMTEAPPTQHEKQ
jgi:hypothetical protein